MSQPSCRFVQPLPVVLLAGILVCGCHKKDETQAGAAASASAPAASASVAQAPEAATATATPTPAARPTAVKGESIDACCSALAAIKKSGKDTAAKRKAEQAGEVCGRIAKLVKDGKTSRKDGLTQIKSALTGTSIPSECE